MAAQCQRVLLVVGACLTVLVFAPPGFIVCFALFVLFGAQVPKHWDDRPESHSTPGSAKDSASALASDDRDAAENLPPAPSVGIFEDDVGPALVLVFDARDAFTGKQTLRTHRSLEGLAGVRWTVEQLLEETRGQSLGIRGLRSPPCNEILDRLRAGQLEYRLCPSHSGEFIFCAVRMSELVARANLSFYPTDLQLDPTAAREYASALGLPLAVRSLPRWHCRRVGRDNATRQLFGRISSDGELVSQVQEVTEQGLPAEVWNDLYIRFMPTLPSTLFRSFDLVPQEEGHSGLRRNFPSVGSLCDCATETGEASESGQSSVRAAETTAWRTDSAIPQATLLCPAARMRLLLNLASDDLPGALGGQGPGLKLDQWRTPKLWTFIRRTFNNLGACRPVGLFKFGHLSREAPAPLLTYFLVQDPRDAVYQRLADRFSRPASPHFRHALFVAIADRDTPRVLRRYFGEQIAFYFSFVQHLFSYGLALSVLLAPLLMCYSIAWARRMVVALREHGGVVEELIQGLASEIATSEAGSVHWPQWSLLIGLATTVWGQCVIGSWQRAERRLATEWGSSRAGALPTPRPNFLGRLALSRIDGRLTQVHASQFLYTARLVAYNLLFFLLTLLFAGAVACLTCSRMEVMMTRSIGQRKALMLGACYSVVTVMLHAILRSIAHFLTELENHRSESPWEASVLVKKWILTVIVETCAVGYLLFARPVLWPCAYGDTDVRRRLGVDDCEPWDATCCDVLMTRGVESLLSFAEVRNEAVVSETRQFVAGWLVSKIVVHNALKWLLPRFGGFLFMRGIYPCIMLDFARDLIDQIFQSDGARRRVRRTRCCRRLMRRRHSQGSPADTTVLGSAGPMGFTEEMLASCELQLDMQDPWDVLETANDLSVHFLVTSLTTVIYPFAPLLFVAHLLIEFQMDLYMLFDRRQPQPRAARGLPTAWHWIFQSYVYLGAASNLLIVTYRTPLVREVFGTNEVGSHIAFFSSTMLLLVFVVGLVHLAVPAVSEEVAEHLKRQEDVEDFFAVIAGQRSYDLQVGAKRQVTQTLHDPALTTSSPEQDTCAVHQDAEVCSLWERAQKVR